jgi:hypothetical protein
MVTMVNPVESFVRDHYVISNATMEKLKFFNEQYQIALNGISDLCESWRNKMYESLNDLLGYKTALLSTSESETFINEYYMRFKSEYPEIDNAMVLMLEQIELIIDDTLALMMDSEPILKWTLN